MVARSLHERQSPYSWCLLGNISTFNAVPKEEDEDPVDKVHADSQRKLDQRPSTHSQRAVS